MIDLFELRDRVAEAEDRVILVSVYHLESEPIPGSFLDVGATPPPVDQRAKKGYVALSIPVIAEVYGDWGIHSFLDDDEKRVTTHWSGRKAVAPIIHPGKYSITHVPSGLRFMSLSSLLSARLMIAHIESSRFYELLKEHGSKTIDFAEGQDAIADVRLAAEVFNYPLAEESFGGAWSKEAS